MTATIYDLKKARDARAKSWCVGEFECACGAWWVSVWSLSHKWIFCPLCGSRREAPVL